jgi:hypothetical protein
MAYADTSQDIGYVFAVTARTRQPVLGIKTRVALYIQPLGRYKCFLLERNIRRIRDSSDGIVTGYGMDDRSSIPGKGRKFFSTPQRPTQPRI